MKIEKNKIVFGAVIAVILLFLISYSFLIMEDDKDENHLQDTLVPELQQETKVYESKLDAINDLKEVRETNAPSIYNEKLFDSLGYYDVELTEKEKERIVDSIYEPGLTTYPEETYEDPISEQEVSKSTPNPEVEIREKEQKILAKEMGLEHQFFFASSPTVNKSVHRSETDSVIYAVVDGNQVVKGNSRIRMRLIEDAQINGQKIFKNTRIFGFVSFQPNRTLVEIENINHHPVKLKAFDLQDGSEGIYVENNFRAEATSEVLDDIIQDINIPSVPQISGITKVLRRNNRNVKVTVLNNYKLILKEKP